MAHSSSGPDASSLFGHLETLYPLAHLLAGPDEAPALLHRVFERAGTTRPADRPDDLEGWLLRLLLDEHEADALTADEEERSPESTPDAPDALWQEVAQQVAEDALPTALATCSVQEQSLLALDVFSGADDRRDATLATAFDTTASEAQELQSKAWAALRDHLREVLSAPERTLVDEALPDETLREAVRDELANRFPRVPPSLRAQIRATLQTASPTEESPSREETFRPDETTLLLDRLPSALRGRSLLLGLAVLVLVIAGGIGVSYLTQPASTPSPSRPSLVAFSAQRADSVQPALTTHSASEAKAYVASTWNRRVAVPSIGGIQLRGVGRLRVENGVEIPTFLYADPDDTSRVAIFAYSYALLDRMEAQATLGTRLREELAHSKHLVTHQNSMQGGILWRHQDDIFVAVTPTAPPESLRLRDRIRPGG